MPLLAYVALPLRSIRLRDSVNWPDSLAHLVPAGQADFEKRCE